MTEQKNNPENPVNPVKCLIRMNYYLPVLHSPGRIGACFKEELKILPLFLLTITDIYFYSAPLTLTELN